MSRRRSVRVWAPETSHVELVLDDRRVPMTRTGEDHVVDVDVSDADTYAFSLDGGDPLPDPRGLRMPEGHVGRSAFFDVDAFAWSDRSWAGTSLAGAVIYELHVGTFTPEGTLDAAAARLDHLVDLGVTVVELLPVSPFPGRHGWGYDGIAPYAVHEPYGGPAALQRFVDSAHAHGLGVCLDVVYNHLGPDGNRLAEFGPYLTDAHVTPGGRRSTWTPPAPARCGAGCSTTSASGWSTSTSTGCDSTPSTSCTTVAPCTSWRR